MYLANLMVLYKVYSVPEVLGTFQVLQHPGELHHTATLLATNYVSKHHHL